MPLATWMPSSKLLTGNSTASTGPRSSFLRQAVVGLDAVHDGRNTRSRSGARGGFCHDLAFLAAHLDVLEAFFWAPALMTAPIVFLGSRTSPTERAFVWHDAREGLVDLAVHDQARAGRTLLTLEAEGRRDDAGGRLLQVRRLVHQDEVLAAHLQDGALDPDLPGPASDSPPTRGSR